MSLRGGALWTDTSESIGNDGLRCWTNKCNGIQGQTIAGTRLHCTATEQLLPHIRSDWLKGVGVGGVGGRGMLGEAGIGRGVGVWSCGVGGVGGAGVDCEGTILFSNRF